MKYIVATIKPHKLDTVRDALAEIGISGLTTTDVKGFGQQKGHTELYRGAEYVIDFLPKTKLEIVVPDAMAEQVIKVIQAAAFTGVIGDGMLFVVDSEGALRIRTSETDDDALL